MVELLFNNNILLLDSIDYRIEEMGKNDDMVVTIHLINDVYNTYYTVKAYAVKINGIIQTSADMIIQTLSNG